MTVRSVLSAMALLAALTVPFPSKAQAQPNRPFGPTTARPQPGTTTAQPRQNVNERHERAKTEAQQASQKGDHEHALTLLQSVIAENPRDDVAYYLRGSARVELGRRKGDAKLLRDGVADARQAISLKQRDNALYYLPYLYGMSSLSAAENRPEHAEVAVKVANQFVNSGGLKDEDKANILYQVGVAHMTLKDPKAAAADFESALRTIPNHVGAHMALADAYVRDNNLEKAAAAFDKAVAAVSRSPLVYNNRGMFRQSQGDTGKAIEDFTRAIELDESFYTAMTNRGYALLGSGNVAAAEADFSSSLAANPNQDHVYSLRGASRLAQGKIDAASSDFTRLIERSPKNPIGWSDLGFAKYFAGDYQGALRAFDQAATINPQLKFLNPWRHQALLASGATPETVNAFVEKNSGEVKEDDWAGGLFAYVAGRLNEEELLKRAESKDERAKADQLCEAHFFIAQKLAREGKTEEANQHYEKVLATGSRHLSTYRGAQFALKKFPGAGAGT